MKDRKGKNFWKFYLENQSWNIARISQVSSHNSQLFVLLFAVFLLPASTWRPAVTVNTGMLGDLLQSPRQCTVHHLPVNTVQCTKQSSHFRCRLFNVNCSAVPKVRMAGNCRQCPQFSYFNLQNPKSWARNREERLREIFQTASNRRGFVIIWSPSSHLQDISPHGWPAHISAIFELIRATLIPTLGLFECPLSELACQIGANSAWFVQFDPKSLIPHTLSKFAPCS